MVTKIPSVSLALLPMLERGVLLNAKLMVLCLKNKAKGSF